MSEKDEIRELMARYCFALDEERFDDMAALFTEDGVWETAFGTGTGRAGIANQARSISTPNRPRRVHLNTNIVIDFETDDTAKVRSYWQQFQNSAKDPEISSGGSYYDTVVKIGGRWFFRHRRIDRFVKA
jgi:uncharacterized protein (TIGR02246 family)